MPFRSHRKAFTSKLPRMPSDKAHNVPYYNAFIEGNYAKAEREYNRYVSNTFTRPTTGMLFDGWISAEKHTVYAMEKASYLINFFETNPSVYANAKSLAIWDTRELKRLDELIKSGAYALRAEMHLRKRNYDSALVDANEAIKVNPTYEPAFVIRAEAYLNMQKWKNAIEDSLKAIKLNPKYEPAYIVLGQAYLREDNYADAIRAANAALTLSSNNAMAHALLSDAYAKQGKYDDSIAEASKALEVMHAKNLSDTDKDFSKLPAADIKQLKARCALDKAMNDLNNYGKKLQSDLNNKKLTEKNRTKLENKITAFKELGDNIQGPLISLMKGSGNKDTFIKFLRSKDNELGEHRGYGKIIKNVWLAVGLLGVGYVFAGLIHLAATGKKHFVFFNDTTTMKKVKKIEKQAHALAKAEEKRFKR